MTEFDPTDYRSDINDKLSHISSQFMELAIAAKQQALTAVVAELLDAFEKEGYYLDHFLDALADYCYKRRGGGETVKFLEQAASVARLASRSAGK